MCIMSEFSGRVGIKVRNNLKANQLRHFFIAKKGYDVSTAPLNSEINQFKSLREQLILLRSFGENVANFENRRERFPVL